MKIIIQVSTGCSMSSAYRATLMRLLKLHGHPSDSLKRKGIRDEFFKPHKNPLYEEGMSKQDLILKTIDEIGPFLGKMNPDLLYTIMDGTDHHGKKFVEVLSNKGCKFIYMYRTSFLDKVICSIKDWSTRSKIQRNLHDQKSFSDWRESQDRKEVIIEDSADEILKKVYKEIEKHKRIIEKFKKLEVPLLQVKNDELLNYQNNLDKNELEKSLAIVQEIFQYLDIYLDENKTRSFLLSKQGTREKPYSHNELWFSDNQSNEIKEELQRKEFAHFWRE